MESPKHHFICTLLVMLAHFHVVNAQNPDQSGFISLDCGLSAGSSYTEKSTELSYVSDAPFISTGVSGSLLPEYGHEYQQQMRHLRSFPEGIRNCYKLNVTKGTKYLIMTSFLYGNYDNRNKTPEFDLHIGVNYWDSVRFRSASAAVSSEIIYTPTRGYVDLCLVNTGQGTPFIQAIELRPLLSAMYDIHDSIALLTVARADLGSVQDITYRYPNDAYDRTWSPFLDRELKALTTNLTVERESHDVDYWLPNKVMQTAAMPSDKISGAIHFYVNPPNLNTRIYIYAHFAELQELQPGEYRAVNIIVDGELLLGPIVPRYLSPITVYNTKALTRKDNYSFSIERPRNSTLPPILNSIEFYIDLEFSQTETLEDDVNAMNSIKSTYNVERDWNGDPCGPADYTWTGVSCSSNNDFDPPRITSLNLSSSGLTGQITEEFSKLAIIDSLDLSNNSLTGSVPEFLASLVNLKVLDISGNNLTGSLPAKLTEKTKNGSLLLRFDENDQILCDSSSCSSKKKSDIVIPIAASIGGLVFLFGIVSTIILLRQKKQNQGVRPLRNMESNIEPLGFDNRKFTFANIKKMTNNFERVLGKGAFGIVYYGLIDNATPVAVKMLSLSSSQGFHEFQTEVMFLVRVHHKNLTSLVGYCNEESNKVLVYEYMANGNLDDYLSGDTRNSNWEGRLNIAIDAAQGLEYLHRGCKPPIVHRDVKTSNILLTENFQAKLSDFGLSKEFPTDDRTHMSTDVAGTPGYLDPEYYSRNRLNEKSDVYSFGVVLLRIITNKPAFVTSSSNERTHIGNWVTAILNIGDIESIVDQRLVREFNINSIWRAVEISINCLSPSANDRPNMNQVVSELNECLAIEHAPRNVVDNIEVLSMNLDTIVNPLAR